MSKINKKLINLGLIILAIFFLSTALSIPLESKAYNENLYYHFASNPEPTNPKPSISSIKPNSIENIQNKVTITIVGSGFMPSSVVKKNNINRPTTFIDSSHLLVDIYASDMYDQNNFYLTVYNVEPGGGYSNASQFSIKNNTTVNNSTTSSNTNNQNSNYPSTTTDANSYSNYNNTSNTDNNTVSTDSSNESFGGVTANALVGGNTFMPSGLAQWILLIIVVLAIIFLWRYVHGSKEVYMSKPLKHA